jgi:AGZA family xanthine/uracil permease-like MFS transporter
VFGVFQQAAIGLFPMIVLFALYGSKLRLPGRLPPALVAIGVGAALVAVLRALHLYNVPLPVMSRAGIYLPHAVNVVALLRERAWWGYLAIILPLAALDTLASLLILESIKCEGDDYATRPSLLMNGVGTLAAACLGSPFPTTLYLGHAAHKANGARAAYSTVNGLVTVALCCTGVLPIVLRFVPLEVAAPVIVWFGLVTVGQAFAEVPKNEALAVALGLLPALAQWATTLADTVARKAGSSLFAIAPKMGDDLAMGGLIALGQGSLLTSMLWCAALALMVQRRFVAAAGWMAALAVLACFGVIHAYRLGSEGVESVIGWGAAPAFAWAYAAGVVFLLGCAWWARREGAVV